MERRRFDSKFKSQIVLEGLRGRKVSEIRLEYSISQGQYYKWREQFLDNSHQLLKPQAKIAKRSVSRTSMSAEINGRLYCHH